MAQLEKYFVGKSPNGDLREAIQDALIQAAEKWDKDTTGWVVRRIAENKLELGPLSVRIRVGEGGKGDGGIGPK